MVHIRIPIPSGLAGMVSAADAVHDRGIAHKINGLLAPHFMIRFHRFKGGQFVMAIVQTTPGIDVHVVICEHVPQYLDVARRTRLEPDLLGVEYGDGFRRSARRAEAVTAWNAEQARGVPQ